MDLIVIGCQKRRKIGSEKNMAKGRPKKRCGWNDEGDERRSDSWYRMRRRKSCLVVRKKIERQVWQERKKTGKPKRIKS